MKKIVVLALGAVIFSFIFSCTGELPGPPVFKTVKVVHMCTTPELAPRYGCGGKELAEPKVVGWHNVTDTLQGLAVFSEKDLNDLGYFYSKSSNSTNGQTSGAMLDPANWFWWPLLFLLVFGIMAWQLYRLANCCNAKNKNPAPTNPPATPSSNPPAVQPANPPTVLASDALVAVKERGGSMSYRPDGGFDIKVNPPAPKRKPTLPAQKEELH